MIFSDMPSSGLYNPLRERTPNTTYLERAVESLKAHGHGVDESLLQHLSPMGWEHINLTGDYVWPASKHLQKAKFRPLRSYPMAIAVGMLIAEHPPHRSRRA